MALEEYVGSIVLEVDSVEVEIVSLTVQSESGRKLVKTMNSKGRAKGISKGITTYSLNVKAVIPLKGALDWMQIAGSKLTQFPLALGGQTITYQDVCCLSSSEQYTLENEAVIDLQLVALNRIEE